MGDITIENIIIITADVNMIYLNTDDLSYTLTIFLFVCLFVCLFDSVFRIKILALPRLLTKRFLVSQTDLHKFTTIYIAER